MKGPEDLSGQLDGDRGDRGCALPDTGLGPDLSASRERRLEEAVEHWAREGRGGGDGPRQLERIPDLALDLGFSRDHCIQTRRDGEEVPRGIGSPFLEGVGGWVAVDPPDPLAEEPEAHRPRPLAGRGKDVGLGPVAGGEEDGLVGGEVAPEREQRAPRLLHAVGDLLTYLDGRGLVTHPDHGEGEAHARGAPPYPALTGRVPSRPP